MRPSRVTFVVLLALLGVGLVAGITYAGSRLVSQPIGLAAEPHDLSSSLTAPAADTSTTTTTSRTTTTHAATTTHPATTKTAPATASPVAPTPPAATTAPVTTTPAFTVPSARRDGHDNDGDDD